MTPKYRMNNRIDDEEITDYQPYPYESPQRSVEPHGFPVGRNPHQLAARGFAQVFGLQPAAAVLTVGVDLMINTATIISGGLLIPVSAMAGAFLGFIVYRIQKKSYNDDHDSALIKALIVALLTAIPSPLPYLLFVPAGVVGLFRRKER
jgi:hypothetical protein